MTKDGEFEDREIPRTHSRDAVKALLEEVLELGTQLVTEDAIHDATHEVRAGGHAMGTE